MSELSKAEKLDVEALVDDGDTIAFVMNMEEQAGIEPSVEQYTELDNVRKQIHSIASAHNMSDDELIDGVHKANNYNDDELLTDEELEYIQELEDVAEELDELDDDDDFIDDDFDDDYDDFDDEDDEDDDWDD